MDKKFKNGIEVAWILVAVLIATTAIVIDYYEDQYTIELQHQLLQLQKENEMLRRGLILANDYIKEMLQCIKTWINDEEFYDVITEIGCDYWDWYYQYFYNKT